MDDIDLRAVLRAIPAAAAVLVIAWAFCALAFAAGPVPR